MITVGVRGGRCVLEKTPSELVPDIIDRGVAGALLRRGDYLTTFVVEGAVKAFPMVKILQRNLPLI